MASSKYNAKTSGVTLVNEFASTIKDKVILVSGTSPGSIGALYCHAIASAKPAMLILAGRTQEKTAQTASTLRGSHPNIKVKELLVDFASFDSVRSAATEVMGWADVSHLDLLVSNAAIMAPPYRKTVDGHEAQWQTNHLGPWLFVNLVMEKVMASESPRVVLVSSDGHRMHPIRWADYDFSDGKTYNKWSAYGQSKTAVCLTAVALAKRLGGKGLKVYSLHPGIVVTSNLSRDLDMMDKDLVTFNAADVAMGNKFMHGGLTFKTEDEITATHIFASFSEDLNDYNGYYLMDCHVADQWNEEVWPWAINRIEAERLWALNEKMLGQEFRY
ncbi:Short-chain dehydrogenase/reductase family [Pleurostoma richardsiae]|uniref:Short-chain dehydrogenase/reductase family n=1 Tax=Pleurostoma richardsiae TaxID=41990 RepID=A0AA38VIJ4_9PEZI|nr:Short-chain dehydrogenase/reductase family [Pleurostoma richardsiae]